MRGRACETSGRVILGARALPGSPVPNLLHANDNSRAGVWKGRARSEVIALLGVEANVAADGVYGQSGPAVASVTLERAAIL